MAFAPGLALSMPAAPTTAGIASRKARATTQTPTVSPRTTSGLKTVKSPVFCLMEPNPGKDSRIVRPLCPLPKARP
jgi:hypothetical protein